MANKAQGTVLKIDSDVVAELTSISGLELSADTIEVTNLGDEWRTFLQGMKDGGEVSIEGFFNPGDVGQDTLYSTFNSGAIESFEIEFPSGIGAKWSFDGIVTAFSTSADMEEAVSFEATIKVTGEPTLTLATS
jgi:predicted secreted protein